MTSEQEQELRDAVRTLEISQDRDALEAAATRLAASEHPDFIGALREFLRTREFLERLDDLGEPSWKTLHLSRIFGTLEQHPTPATEELCLVLVNEPDFLADDDRKIFLLPALAAVRPMSNSAVETFRRTNAEGYYNLNARLLVRNGSPRALALFEEMIRDETVPEERRVDNLHAAVLPYRTEIAVLQTMDRLVSGDLPDRVRIGAVETIYDERSREWFGPARNPPAPPPWETASDEALTFVLRLASQASFRELPPPLAAAVDRTVRLIQDILASRRR